MFLRFILLLFLSVLSGCLFFDSSSTDTNGKKSDVSDDLVVYVPACLNGILDDGETCDGTKLDNNTCETLGFHSGTLGCSTSCTFNTLECVPMNCGNEVVDNNQEVCDESAPVVFPRGTTEASCSIVDSKYHSGGELRCKNCQYDFGNCNFCGNGVIDGEEECDGGGFLTPPLCSSDDSNKPRGEVKCAECSLDYSECKRGFVQVSVGEGHACAVMTDGEVVCWGGAPSANGPLTGNFNFVKVSVGDEISCGLTSNKNVRCWKRDGSKYIDDSIVNVRQVSVGTGHVCIVKEDNKVRCYFDSTWTTRMGNYNSITSGSGFACGMNLDNAVINCWTTDGTLTPTVSSDFISFSAGFIFLSAGRDYVCGLTKDNEVECTNGVSKDDIIKFDVGSNGICWTKASEQKCDAQLGDPPQLQFSQFSVGNQYACGVVGEEGIQKGTIACWGTAYLNGAPGPLNNGL